MIVQEQFEIDGVDFIHTYSDRGVMIHGGVPEGDYSEACDPASFGRTFTETDIPVDDQTIIEDKAEAYDILMGVTE